MSKSSPDLVPGSGKEVGLGDERIDLGYFTDEALSLIDRVKDKPELTDDDKLMLALTAPQAVLARHCIPIAPDCHQQAVRRAQRLPCRRGDIFQDQEDGECRQAQAVAR